jgi:hypothetical protein
VIEAGDVSTEKICELFDSETRIRNDAAQGAEADLLVIGNNCSSVGVITPQNHVASGLATKDETSTLQSGSHLPT